MAVLPNWLVNILPKSFNKSSYLQDVVTGSLYRIIDTRGVSAEQDIYSLIQRVRALATDAQVATALSYYATDSTVPNSDGDILWATPAAGCSSKGAEMCNVLLNRWNVNAYARSHILELLIVGNLYIPTTKMYASPTSKTKQQGIVLDNNTLVDETYDIIPMYKLDPTNILHLYRRGESKGFVYHKDTEKTILPSSAIIHFHLDGLLGDYSVTLTNKSGEEEDFDILFSEPLMTAAMQPTQTLSLLEDAMLLSSLTRVVRFIFVECGGLDEDEARSTLQIMKDTIEQHLSVNTTTGDSQSFVNPQSPNNLIFAPMIDGQVPIQTTDLNMADTTETESQLLDHFENQKLSVLGVPKEALNYSSAEGLGNAGTVLSQRSQLYANVLQRIKTCYISGWRDALNSYFNQRNLKGLVDSFELHMMPTLTAMSTIQEENKSRNIEQARSLIDVLEQFNSNKLNETAVIEALQNTFPTTVASIEKESSDETSEDSEELNPDQENLEFSNGGLSREPITPDFEMGEEGESPFADQ